MAENSNKIKLLKFYELLQKDTDEDRPISRQELVRLLCEQGVPVGIRTIDRDIDALTKFGFEIITFKKDHERYYYVPEREFSIPELNLALRGRRMSNASFRIFRPKEFGRGRPLPYGWGFRCGAGSAGDF